MAKSVDRYNVRKKFVFSGSVAMYRRGTMLKRLGGFDGDLFSTVRIDLGLRAAGRGGCLYRRTPSWSIVIRHGRSASALRPITSSATGCTWW